MICKKCGKEIKEGNNFCTNCGTAINSQIADTKVKNINIKNNKKTKIIVAIIIAILIIVISIAVIVRTEQYKKQNNNTVQIEEKQENISAEHNEEKEETEKKLLEEIYSKYPELKDTEGIICTDGTDYWLLDTNGKKVYFESLTEFEEAYTKYYKNTETDDKNNSTTNNEDDTYVNNSNENTTTETPTYQYTFSSNEYVILKETSSSQPTAYWKVKCKYCGKMLLTDYVPWTFWEEGTDRKSVV